MTEIGPSSGVFAQKADAPSSALATLMALFANGADSFANGLGELQGEVTAAQTPTSFQDLVASLSASNTTPDGNFTGLEDGETGAWAALFGVEEASAQGLLTASGATVPDLNAGTETGAFGLGSPELVAEEAFTPLFSLTANAHGALAPAAPLAADPSVSGQLSLDDQIILEAFPELQSFLNRDGGPNLGQLTSSTGTPSADIKAAAESLGLQYDPASATASLEQTLAQPLTAVGQETPTPASVAQAGPDILEDDHGFVGEQSLPGQQAQAQAQAQAAAAAEASGLVATPANPVKPGQAEMATAAANIKESLSDADKGDGKATNTGAANTQGQSGTTAPAAAAASNGNGQGGTGQSPDQRGQQGEAFEQYTPATRGPASETSALADPAQRADTLAPLKAEPQAPLTPERLAGWSDLRPFEAIAGGLSALKAETALSEPTILANRANPALAQDAMRQMSVAVARAIEDGDTQFTVRLNPAELGRVTMKLNFAEGGGLRATVMAQNPETLEMLQRDIRGLERALEAGGHKVESGGLQLALDQGDRESAGRQLAEAMMEEQMRDNLASKSAEAGLSAIEDPEDSAEDAAAPHLDSVTDASLLEKILPHVSAETGIDIRI